MTIATQEETKHFVKKYLKENLGVNFTEKDILSVEPVFDVEDNLLAHHYKLINKKSEKYFFVISAQKKYSPILVAGEGDIEDIKISSNDSAKKYFIGGFSVVTADNPDQLLNTIMENNPSTTKKQLIDELIVEENLNAKKVWQENLVVTPQDYTIYAVTDKLLSVPFFNQFDPNIPASIRGSACGPTTVAAILEYWKTYKGKSKISGSAQYGSKGAFVDRIYKDTYSTLYGMSVTKLKEGLGQHALNTGGYSSTTSSYNSFTTYMGEINNFRPVAVKFDSKFVWNEPDRDYYYNYHWTVGAGYYYDTNYATQTLKVHTNGGRNTNGTPTDSKVVLVDYAYNAPIITMVNFNIN